MSTAYLAAEGFDGQLLEELRRCAVVPVVTHGRLLICDGSAVPAAWAANIWHDCIELPVASIGTAAKALRDIQRNWFEGEIDVPDLPELPLPATSNAPAGAADDHAAVPR